MPDTDLQEVCRSLAHATGKTITFEARFPPSRHPSASASQQSRAPRARGVQRCCLANLLRRQVARCHAGIEQKRGPFVELTIDLNTSAVKSDQFLHQPSPILVPSKSPARPRRDESAKQLGVHSRYSYSDPQLGAQRDRAPSALTRIPPFK